MATGELLSDVCSGRQPLLSIVIPFHNSLGKCEVLLTTLAQCVHHDVEFILVDDGSTDGTIDALERHAGELQNRVQVIQQDNRGPGGARNTGLKAALGEYVWFVDSDDDIVLNAIDIVRENRTHKYDFIDFNLLHEGIEVNSMELPEGEYESLRRSGPNQFLSAGHGLRFGRLCTKVFRREFLRLIECTDVGMYPEYCVYEDNPIAMVLAVTPCRFLKSEAIGYHHITESLVSVTRGSVLSPRTFDRVLTAAYGLERARMLTQRSEEVAALETIYVRLAWYNTLGMYRVRWDKPRFWIVAVRLTRRFRDDASRLRVSAARCFSVRQSRRRALWYALVWLVSHALPPYQGFDESRQQAWGRAVRFPCAQPRVAAFEA